LLFLADCLEKPAPASPSLLPNSFLNISTMRVRSGVGIIIMEERNIHSSPSPYYKNTWIPLQSFEISPNNPTSFTEHLHQKQTTTMSPFESPVRYIPISRTAKKAHPPNKHRLITRGTIAPSLALKCGDEPRMKNG
jgi:hypothetical protein